MKLTPSAQKAVLKLEKEHKADEEEMRPRRQHKAAADELGSAGLLLEVTSKAWVDAKEMLVSYQERILVHGEMVLRACRAPLPPSSVTAGYTAAVHRHMALVANNYSKRAHELDKAIISTRAAMQEHYNALRDEGEVERLIENQCKDWKAYIKEWKRGDVDGDEKTEFALAK